MPSEQLLGLWGHERDVWKSGQIGLPQVIRWDGYVQDAEHGGARTQDTLAHSYSLTMLGLILMEQLPLTVDKHLMTTSFLVHDHGEGELGRDILYAQKTEQGDLDEYLAFKKRFSILGDTYSFFERAFLIQFALKAPTSFPPDAQRIMQTLEKENGTECLFFDAVERFDYLLYALEQYEERGNTRILVHVLRKQLPHLSRLAGALPAFSNTWTPNTESLCKAFLAEYEGLWLD